MTIDGNDNIFIGDALSGIYKIAGNNTKTNKKKKKNKSTHTHTTGSKYSHFISDLCSSLSLSVSLYFCLHALSSLVFLFFLLSVVFFCICFSSVSYLFFFFFLCVCLRSLHSGLSSATLVSGESFVVHTLGKRQKNKSETDRDTESVCIRACVCVCERERKEKRKRQNKKEKEEQN